MSEQRQFYCTGCQCNRLHVKSSVEKQMGCGEVTMHLILCVITVGIWIPIFFLLVGLRSFGNNWREMKAKYHCQHCGQEVGKVTIEVLPDTCNEGS